MGRKLGLFSKFVDWLSGDYPTEAQMVITLERFRETEYGTFGRLMLDGKQLCLTLEEPWNYNRKGVSCIPTGTYKCIKHNGNRFKDVWEVTGVRDRSAILIHSGNSIADTMGCILVGTKHTEQGLLESLKALNKLRNMLPDTFELEVTYG
jgi:hypothetical protein